MFDFLIYSIQNINLFIPSIEEFGAFIGLILFIIISILIGTNFSHNNNLISINFFVGYGFIYFLTVAAYVIFSIEVRLVYFFILFSVLFFSLFNLKTMKSKVKNILLELKLLKPILLATIPLFLYLFNSKGIGWDVFSHWLPLANALDQSSEFLLRGHATNYPFASSIVLVYSSILFDGVSENVSALFSIIQLIFVFEIMFYIFKKQNLIKDNISHKLILLLLILFTPIHMNKFVYSSYVDFDIAVAIFVFTFLLYQIIKDINNNKLILQISLVGCLVIGLKNTGIVLIFFSLISFLIISSFQNFKTTIKKYFFPMLYFSIPVFLCWMIWQYLLISNSMTEKFIVYDHLRFELIDSFFDSVFFQINERKFFYYSSFIIIFLSFFRKKLFKSNELMLFFIPFYSIFFIQWFIFLIITYIFHFNPGILENATSFWRYNFHISIILLLIFSYFVFLIIKRFSFVEKKIIINFIAVIIVIIPLVFLSKFRRDLEPKYLTINDFKNLKNEVSKALVVSEDSSYNAVRLNYYLNNDYRKSIVDYIEISDKNKNYDIQKFNNNNMYELIIIIDQTNLLNFKKKI